MIRGSILAMNIENEKKTELFKYLDELEDNNLFLECLQSAGVDNWIGYSDAQDEYRECKEE